MSARHFVKYTFLKLDPAWRRRDAELREQDKREFAAACDDFADGHMLQALSLERVATAPATLDRGPQAVPADINDTIARCMLVAMGASY